MPKAKVMSKAVMSKAAVPKPETSRIVGSGEARSKSSTVVAPAEAGGGRNVVVLHGVVRTEPVVKALASGDVLVSFDLRIPGPDGKRVALPVSWIGSAERVPELVADEAVVVVGQVARRFFRTQMGLASRIDVRAQQIVKGTPTRRRKAIVAAQLLLS